MAPVEVILTILRHKRKIQNKSNILLKNLNFRACNAQKQWK